MCHAASYLLQSISPIQSQETSWAIAEIEVLRTCSTILFILPSIELWLCHRSSPARSLACGWRPCRCNAAQANCCQHASGDNLNIICYISQCISDHLSLTAPFYRLNDLAPVHPCAVFSSSRMWLKCYNCQSCCHVCHALHRCAVQSWRAHPAS